MQRLDVQKGTLRKFLALPVQLCGCFQPRGGYLVVFASLLEPSLANGLKRVERADGIDLGEGAWQVRGQEDDANQGGDTE